VSSEEWKGAIPYYNREGEPIDMDEWTRLSGGPGMDGDYRRIDSTYLMAGMETRWVSTVWLGLDHGFGMGGPPVIFETMIFDQAGTDYGQWRYSTEDQARAGHQDAVFVAKGQLSLATGGEPVSEVIEVEEVRAALGIGSEEEE